MLTNASVKAAVARDKDYKLADSGGLFLLVKATGYKSWRFKYRVGPKEKLLVFGSYPEMSLAEARDKRDDARKARRDGRDPALEKQKAKLVAATATERSFETFARRWHAQKAPRWTPIHAADVLNCLASPCRGSLRSGGVYPCG